MKLVGHMVNQFSIFHKTSMKKIILLFSIICIGQYAVSQTKQALIAELFIVMKQDSMMELLGKNMAKSIYMQNQMIKKSIVQNIEPSQKINVNTENLDMMVAANKYAEISLKYMKTFVKDDLANSDEKHYSENEIKDFIQFYKSASGQKLLNETPKLQAETMQIIMQKYMPKMMNEIESDIKQLLEKEK